MKRRGSVRGRVDAGTGSGPGVERVITRAQGGEGVRGFVEDIKVGETMARIKSYVSALVRLANFGMGFKIFFWGYVVHTFPQVIPSGKSLPGSPSSLWENWF